jgi:uncharacterized membrane protein
VSLTTRRIVVAAVLSAISILLGFTRLGYIPVPNVSGNATIMGVPVYIGSVLEGWPVGAIVGFIFGLSSFVTATIPAFKDPLVAILPRIIIGITPWLVYIAVRKWNEIVAFGLAGLVGSLTNTILVVGMIILRGYYTFDQMLSVIPQAIAEAVLSVILTVIVCAAWKRIQIGSGQSKISKGQ